MKFVLVAMLGAALSAQAQTPATPRAQDAAAVPLSRAVRIALGHGNLDEAKRVANTTRESSGRKLVAAALISIYEGKDEDALRTLAPLAMGDAGDPDAILEAGLIHMRHGRKDEAMALLERVVNSQQDLDTDAFLRLARAADALGDVNLANSVFQRIGSSETDRADVQSAWGDLFLETHANAEAARSYADALKADDNWIPALVGSARALADDDPAAADAMLAKAQKLAPASPDVWLLTAERQLQQQDFSAAKTSLDKVAAVRPGTTDELALRAAATYATGTARDVDPLVTQFRQLNPKSPELLRAVANEAAQLYRFDDAVVFARQAAAVDPDIAGPHADLGMYLLRTGDETEARTELEQAFKIDPYDTITFNSLQMLDEVDKFKVVTDGPFIFKFSQEDAAVLTPYALPLARQAYDEYVKRYGFTPKGPILVEVFDQHDSFAVRTLGLPGIVGALGACFGRVIAMDSPKAHPNGIDFSWQATLWHEIAHVFTLQLSNYKVPRWLTEGLSQYEEHRRSAPWGRELTMEYARLLAQGETFTLKKLSDSFKNPRRISMAYFEASLLAEHLEDLGGTAALQSLLTSYAGGAKDADAFTKAFGKGVPEIEASFNAFIDQRFGALKAAMKDPAPPAVEEADLAGLKARAEKQPDNYISQMTYATAALQAQQTDAAKTAFERAAKLAPAAGGEDGPFAQLATLAVQAGDKDAARRNLRLVLGADHSNIAAARSLATLATEGGVTADMDFALTRIADLDPFDSDAHTQLGRREIVQNHADRAIVEFQAALALGPANLADAHTDLGEAFLKSGRKDDAKKEAFAALELAPTYARAQDLLLLAIAKEAR